MTQQEFNRLFTNALDLKGRRTPTDVQLRYAWCELGHGKDNDFVSAALKHISHSHETNLPTAVEQARIHAYQQRKVEQVESKGCTECGGTGWYYMQTLRRMATWYTGGAKQTQELDKPTVCQVAYRCAVCNHGRVKVQQTSETSVYDETSGQVINV